MMDETQGKRSAEDVGGDSGAPHIGWTRSCLNIRLTQERSVKLRELARDLGRSATPTDVLDHALELALAARARDDDRDIASADAERTRDALERLCDIGAASAQSQVAALAGLAREVRGLADLISAVAVGDGNSGDGLDDPQTLRSWLDAQTRLSSDEPISARGRWQSKSREGDGRVSLELLMMPPRTSPKKPAAMLHPAIVRISRLDASSPFARTDLISDFLLEARRTTHGGWRAVGFQMKLDGSAGPMFGSIAV